MATKAGSAVASKSAAVKKPVAAKRPAASTAPAKAAAKPAPKAAAKPAPKAAVKPVAKAAATPVVKAAEKPVAKVAPKPAEKAPATAAVVAITDNSKAEAARKLKLKKVKVVRDSFTMPETEYAVLAEVKKACLSAGFAVKKSELLRVGVALIRTLDKDALKKWVESLPPLKAGRPRKEKQD